MTVTRIDLSPELERFGRRTGYGVAVVINVVMLIVVQNILEWGWLPFLTDEFSTVVAWISLSLIASIVANLVYLSHDPLVVKSTGQIGVNLISLLVTYQVLRVFPFDFSTYHFNWGIVVKILLILAIVGAGIGLLTEAYKLASDESDKEGR